LRWPAAHGSEAHSSHWLWPVAFWNWPLEQTLQMPPFSKRPESHFVQNVCPLSGCTEPTGHFVQLDWSFSAVTVCGAQSSHLRAAELMKVPGVHEPQ
jgi:hypothetical protein